LNNKIRVIQRRAHSRHDEEDDLSAYFEAVATEATGARVYRLRSAGDVR